MKEHKFLIILKKNFILLNFAKKKPNLNQFWVFFKMKNKYPLVIKLGV